jgi:hypothetical protein
LQEYYQLQQQRKRQQQQHSAVMAPRQHYVDTQSSSSSSRSSRSDRDLATSNSNSSAQDPSSRLLSRPRHGHLTPIKEVASSSDSSRAATCRSSGGLTSSSCRAAGRVGASDVQTGNLRPNKPQSYCRAQLQPRSHVQSLVLSQAQPQPRSQSQPQSRSPSNPVSSQSRPQSRSQVRTRPQSPSVAALLAGLYPVRNSSSSSSSSRSRSLTGGSWGYTPARTRPGSGGSGTQSGNMKFSWPAGISSGAYMPPFRP